MAWRTPSIGLAPPTEAPPMRSRRSSPAQKTVPVDRMTSTRSGAAGGTANAAPKFVEHLAIEGVALFGAIEGDGADCA